MYTSPNKYVRSSPGPHIPSSIDRRSSPATQLRDHSMAMDRKSLHDARIMENLQVEKELFERRCKELTQTNQALQSEIDALVGRIQEKSVKNLELNNNIQNLQQTVSALQNEVLSQTKESQGHKLQNQALLQRQRELEELGREMNNISIEASRRERDLEGEVQAKTRDLQLRDEVLEKNKQNAELLEKKIEELRLTTQRGIATRDEIIQQQSDEIQALNNNIEEQKHQFRTNLENHDAEFARDLDSRDQLIQRYVQRIKKQAAKIDAIVRSSDALQVKLEESMGREQELDRVIKADSERAKLMADAHRAELSQHQKEIERLQDTVRGLRQAIRDSEEQTKNLVVQIARKEQETDALVQAQEQQIKSHQVCVHIFFFTVYAMDNYSRVIARSTGMG
jgi:hypothetical protein